MRETLYGIFIGFLLAEGSRVIWLWYRRRQAVNAIEDELALNVRMLPQRLDVLRQMKEEIPKKRILPGSGVMFSTRAYEEHLHETFPKLKAIERDNLHVIYGYFRGTNEFMSSFESRIKRDLVEWRNESEVWRTYESWLGEFMQSLNLAKSLTEKFMAGEPVDVFPINFPVKPK